MWCLLILLKHLFDLSLSILDPNEIRSKLEAGAVGQIQEGDQVLLEAKELVGCLSHLLEASKHEFLAFLKVRLVSDSLALVVLFISLTIFTFFVFLSRTLLLGVLSSDRLQNLELDREKCLFADVPKLSLLGLWHSEALDEGNPVLDGHV